MRKPEGEIMYIINIVNVEGEPIVTRSYTEEAFLNMCNDKLHTNYTIEETNKAMRAFLDKYNYLEIHINPLIIEEEPVNKYKQALAEIIRFFKEDEKFARYSGRPIIFVKPALERIEKILKEKDIEIS